MEWVEVAGKTIDEATELALDQLGVAKTDAEVIVMSEPKPGLFGRMRGEARVRARVRPVGPRPKRERSRDRNRGGKREQGAGAGAGTGSRQGPARNGNRTTGESASESRSSEDRANTNAPGTGSGTSRSARRRRNRSNASAGGGNPEGSTSSRAAGPGMNSQRTKETKETVGMAEGMTLEEQGEVGRAFVAGLLAEYGVQATVETRLLDEDTVEIAAIGDDLGLLVGPRGSTLSALQDLTRAVVQRQCPSRTDRILVDVAGYREKRSAALKRFSIQIAEEVMASGQEKALGGHEPG